MKIVEPFVETEMSEMETEEEKTEKKEEEKREEEKKEEEKEEKKEEKKGNKPTAANLPSDFKKVKDLSHEDLISLDVQETTGQVHRLRWAPLSRLLHRSHSRLHLFWVHKEVRLGFWCSRWNAGRWLRHVGSIPPERR